jgi:hypothetical protein
VLSVVEFGAYPDGSDCTLGIQAAIDVAYASGMTVYFPPGVYETGPLTLKHGVSLAGPERVAFNERANVRIGAWLKLKPSDAPMIASDDVNGHQRTASSAVGTGPQRYQSSSIRNLGFDGNRANQTSFDADILRLKQVWNVAVQDCMFFHARGFGINALDCNVLSVKDCGFIQAPIYGESLADSRIVNNEMGGGNGHVGPVLWLSAGNSFCWQNLVGDNFIFNNANPQTVAATFTDSVMEVEDQGWQDYTPVVVDGAGLKTSRTYNLKRLTATTYRLALSRKNVDDGVYVTVTDGEATVSVGPSCNLFVNGGKWNAISGNRIDQASGDGLILDGAIRNAISGNVINSNGMNDANGKSGVVLQNSAKENSFSGNVIDGTETSGLGSKQTRGIYGDSSSTGNAIDASNIVVGHATANIAVTA